MSITDELREAINELRVECEEKEGCGVLWYPEPSRDRFSEIADRIDQGHKNAVMGAMNDALHYANDESMAELGWVRLPEDAEGVPFHVGDHVEVPDGLPSEGKPWQVGTITRLALGSTCWHVHVLAGGMNHVYLTENVRHHHAPTVEDVLTEFTAKLIERSRLTNGAAQTIAEYAAKLRLAGEDA